MAARMLKLFFAALSSTLKLLHNYFVCNKKFFRCVSS